MKLGSPGTTFAFWVLLIAFTVGELASRIRSGLDRRGTRAEGWSLIVVVLGIAIGFVGAFESVAWRPGQIGTGRLVLTIGGLVMMGLGIVLRQWCIFLLGRFFTGDVRIHPGQTVVDRGPYHLLRHPSYAALIVVFTGTGLALGNWLSIAFLAVLPTVGLVVRIHAEEVVLTAALGDEYRRFTATRARLIPGIW